MYLAYRIAQILCHASCTFPSGHWSMVYSCLDHHSRLEDHSHRAKVLSYCWNSHLTFCSYLRNTLNICQRDRETLVDRLSSLKVSLYI